jgi:hypothetical protein
MKRYLVSLPSIPFKIAGGREEFGNFALYE